MRPIMVGWFFGTGTLLADRKINTRKVAENRIFKMKIYEKIMRVESRYSYERVKLETEIWAAVISAKNHKGEVEVLSFEQSQGCVSRSAGATCCVTARWRRVCRSTLLPHRLPYSHRSADSSGLIPGLWGVRARKRKMKTVPETRGATWAPPLPFCRRAPWWARAAA
jgi:hypothetical protein